MSRTKGFILGLFLGFAAGNVAMVGFSYSDDIRSMVSNDNETVEYTDNPHAPVLKINPTAKPDISQIIDLRGNKN